MFDTPVFLDNILRDDFYLNHPRWHFVLGLIYVLVSIPFLIIHIWMVASGAMWYNEVKMTISASIPNIMIQLSSYLVIALVIIGLLMVCVSINSFKYGEKRNG